jgi:hypothetical protein
MTPRSRYFITQVLDLWDPGRIVPITSRRGSSEADVKGGRGMTGDGIEQSILAGSEVGLRAGFRHRRSWITSATAESMLVWRMVRNEFECAIRPTSTRLVFWIALGWVAPHRLGTLASESGSRVSGKLRQGRSSDSVAGSGSVS